LAGLRVSDDKAGKRVRCPGCGETPRAPAAPPQEVEELPVVEDEEEAEDAEPGEGDWDRRPARRRRDDEEEDEGEVRSRKVRKRPPPAEDEAGGHRDFVTRNRIMGAVGFLLGLGFTIGALCTALAGVADLRNPLTTFYNFAGCFGLLLGLALLAVGTIYAIRG
jgi:hypothetical protein